MSMSKEELLAQVMSGGSTMDLTKMEEMFDEDGKEKFDNLPAGKYNAVIHEVIFGQSKAGKPMLTWVFKIEDGDFKDRQMRLWTVTNLDFHVKIIYKIIFRCLKDVVDMKAFNPQELADNGAVIGRRCVIDVSLEEGADFPNSVKDVLAPAGGGDSFFG